MDELTRLAYMVIALMKAGLSKSMIIKVVGYLADSISEYSIEDAKEILNKFLSIKDI